VGITVGTRYIHTVTEMIDTGDLAAARDLLAAWIPTID
jgi:endoglucanase